MIRKMDKTLFFTSMILLVIGLIMVFSASNVTSFMRFQASPYHFFNRHLFLLIVSLIVCGILLTINTKAYGYVSWLIIIGLIVILIAVLISGKMVNQARSWFDIAGIQFQPSEFVKVAAIVWMSSICANESRPTRKTYVIMFSVLLAITILIVLQPDVGTATIFASIVFIMFMSLKISPKIKRNIVLSIIGFIGVALLLLLNNGVRDFFQRQISRFDFSNPCSQEKFYTTGTQLCNGYIAFNNGGLTGLGLGNSTQKYLYLPEAYTDFIFAITVEELGLIVGIIILVMMFVVLWRIFLISKRANTEMGKLMCYGIFWYILIHIVVNLLGIMGLIPLTGVPLPFLSYGGSFLMCLVVSLTIVQRVAIESK